MDREKAEAQSIILESPAGHFRSRAVGLFLVWTLLATAGFGTYLLSRTLRSENAAGAYLAASSRHEISLYADRAEPASLEARAGEEVVFVVRDKSRHNIAEERTKKTDARLESSEFGEGESYSLVFQGKGVFSFYDRLNQDIRVDVSIR